MARCLPWPQPAFLPCLQGTRRAGCCLEARLGRGGVKPQLPGEEEEDAPDHAHVPALQDRLGLAVGYYSSTASGINKRSHVAMNAGPRTSSRCQQEKGQLLVLS